MKKYLIILFLSIYVQVFAQKEVVKNQPNFDKKRIHFGFTIGITTMDFTIKNSDDFFRMDSIGKIYSIQNQSTFGFTLGPITNFRLGEYLDLRALINFNFGQRNLQYLQIDTIKNDISFNTHTMQIASTFMEFPILIKYKAARLNNFRPYIIAGINPKFDLAARKKIKEEELPKIRLKQFDLYYDVGAGVDFYLPYFKLSIELKYSAGFYNIMETDNTEYTRAINKLSSKMWILSFHFE